MNEVNRLIDQQKPTKKANNKQQFQNISKRVCSVWLCCLRMIPEF